MTQFLSFLWLSNIPLLYALLLLLLSCFSHVRLFANPWTAGRQASLSVTNSRSLLKLISIELVMPSNHLIPHCPLFLLPSIFPSIRLFSTESVIPSNHLIFHHPFLLLPSIFPSIWVFVNQSVIHIRWPNFEASASASVLPMNIQD